MRNLVKNVWGLLRNHPTVLYHQPTWRCDCRCEFCDAWSTPPENPNELSPETIKIILSKARKAGFTTYSLWGGEPLVYSGIKDIVKQASQLGFFVILCTNGSYLKEFSADLGPYVDYWLLSLEAVGEKHDQSRRYPGLFQKAQEGVESLWVNSSKGKVVIWTNLNKRNQNQVEELARLARVWKSFIEFFPAIKDMGCKDNLLLNAQERKELFQKVIKLKKQGYPVMNTRYELNLMKNSLPFKCNFPKRSVQLLWDGTLWSCIPRVLGTDAYLGESQNWDWNKIGATSIFQANAKKLENCNKCLFPCVGHHSNNIWIQGLRRFLNQIYYRKFYSFPV